jgi:hypothetical protein
MRPDEKPFHTYGEGFECKSQGLMTVQAELSRVWTGGKANTDELALSLVPPRVDSLDGMKLTLGTIADSDSDVAAVHEEAEVGVSSEGRST